MRENKANKFCKKKKKMIWSLLTAVHNKFSAESGEGGSSTAADTLEACEPQ